MTTIPPFGNPPIEGPANAGPCEEVSGPAALRIELAKAFYGAALKYGPRPASAVLKEGLAAGHTRRTLERARSGLNVQSWPEGYQGPRMIALPGDPAVETIKQRRKERQQRQGNGRKRRKRKQQHGGESAPQDAALATAR